MLRVCTKQQSSAKYNAKLIESLQGGVGTQKSGKLNEILIQSKRLIFQKTEVSYSEKL